METQTIPLKSAYLSLLQDTLIAFKKETVVCQDNAYVVCGLLTAMKVAFEADGERDIAEFISKKNHELLENWTLTARVLKQVFDFIESKHHLN
ncbi:hypothetical protein FWP33_16835 [Vibrio parahaemolyticus]|nr:hypothetical protein [Vibrio parahaemolyticus]EJC7176261.1 hypothetical protein [Vibrio parahaemolyticus]EJG0009996.1 hypothetical protein [Vibrio parahaemolyticus]